MKLHAIGPVIPVEKWRGKQARTIELALTDVRYR